MADSALHDRLDRLIALLEQQQVDNAALKARLDQQETPSPGRRAREHDLSSPTRQASQQADESYLGGLKTPTPATRPHPWSVTFDILDRRAYTDQEKYATPTGPRYVKPVTPEAWTGTGSEQDTQPHAALKTPFPKLDTRDIDIFILEADAWFKANGVYDHTSMILHTAAQLEGTAREWWKGKLRVDRHRQGMLFHDWSHFTTRLRELYNQRSDRVDAYNKLLALRLITDTPGAATRHVKQFRDLAAQCHMEDPEFVIDLFRGSLTRSLQEKFERNPPEDQWAWYREVEDIDRQRMRHQQNAVRFAPTPAIRTAHTEPGIPQRTGSRPLPPHLAQKLPVREAPPRPRDNRRVVPGPTTFNSDACRVCGKTGHWQRNCPDAKPTVYPARPSGPQMRAHVVLESEKPQDGSPEEGDGAEDHREDDGASSASVLELAGTVNHHPASILADTGAALSIVSAPFVCKYSINTKPIKNRTVHGVTGHSLTITSAADVDVVIGGQHLGMLKVAVADASDYNFILGYDELRCLQPRVHWDTGQLDFGKTNEIRSDAVVQGISPKSAETGRSAESRASLVVHGYEFVDANELVQAALRDGPIGVMLISAPPTSLPSFGFVPTGGDKGIEMETTLEEPPTAVEIPAPYYPLKDVFDEVEADKLPPHTKHDLHIELLPSSTPPQGPLYLKGPKEMAELRKYLEENLEKGFIWPSKSPARSPVLFVPKKDGGLRLCVDYRGLNEVTVKNRAPLPLIEEQLFLLRKAKIYTKLDLKAAYNLVRIANGDEWKTAFGTQLGLYEYLVMPFGLANAPAHFQSLINTIYRDIIGVYVVVYLDDFLIFSNNEKEHIEHVRTVLSRLKVWRLFAKLSKCVFHTDTVEFLGYIIKPSGIEMDPDKIRTIKEWPMPESIHNIQRFLGFANFYRRFISHFARIARPLTSLVKPTERFKKFDLPDDARAAFHKLVEMFTTAGVLKHFDYHRPTRLETDASDFALAGVLKQEHDGRWHPIAFYSRKMASAEKNYEIHDKELLAVVVCLNHWRHMLAGLPSQLIILTDHEALKYFKSQRKITGRQARWSVLLADFDFVLQYRPGDKAVEPDALTRRSDMQPTAEEDLHNVRQLLPAQVFAEDFENRRVDSTRRISPKFAKKELLAESQINMLKPTMSNIAEGGLVQLVKTFQPLDAELAELHQKQTFEVRHGLWYCDGRLVVPRVTLPGKKGQHNTRSAAEAKDCSLSVEHLRYMVMSQCHDGATAGHAGRDATLELTRRHYWWPNMAAWVADYVATCPVCARYKAPRHRPYGLLQPLSTPSRPWNSISMDFIEGLPKLEGYDSIFVVVDRLTKYAILTPTYKTITSEQTAKMLKDQVMSRFGVPEHIVSDCGRQFVSAAWKEFTDKLVIHHSLSTAYHPQTDGQTERVNQVVEQYLRMYCNYEQDNWVTWLPMAEFVYNNTVHSSIGVSPFFACYGWNPKSHPNLPEQVGVLDPKRKEFATRRQEFTEYLQEQIRYAQSRTVEQYNRKRKDIEFKVGDMVYVNRKNWKTARPSPKLDTRLAGPFPILERIGRRAYRLQLPASLRVHDVFHVLMLEPQKASSLPQRSTLKVMPPLPDDTLEFEVEAIVGKQKQGRQVQYKVQWRGYPEEAASWEPTDCLNCPDLIREYEESAGGRRH
ncbi:related to pol protein [Melanopsichium pennsylvanicum]|uniref:RNA-directed DNA polymerase n=1 Tax=Melanopsichium pennsylvanicum TaxID=63383 RepID=A0AAJ4XLV8_9BASI|nr:related to pol protein [Melanopsichium pennsylvanicum]